MGRFKRITVIVLDGVGCGEAPDAGEYGDVGSDSLRNVSRSVGGLDCPNMGRLGLGKLTEIEGVPPSLHAAGGAGKCQPASKGKDTVTGHWELMGIQLAQPFPVYPAGFPPEIIRMFEEQTGRGVLANKAASGTVVIQEFGAEHLATAKPIVYTSADSVFQIAAHEKVISVEELYGICRKCRAFLVGEHGLGRVIARPFVGDERSGFARTKRRKDFPLLPATPTMMQRLVDAGKEVWSIGKIDDIFGHQGITRKNHTTDNAGSTRAILDSLEEDFEGLLFANLIEFDMIYGHRNDPRGYADALEAFDLALPSIVERMGVDDLGIITADHGVDPTTPGTDHSREFVPLLAFGPALDRPVELGVRETLSDVAATLAENFELDPPLTGKGFLQAIQP